jgi:hypothetical protein
VKKLLAQLRPSGRLGRELLWDAFMVWVALINLGLILFDLSYLLLRPTYQWILPPLVRLYDPVKGIGPHPLTAALLAEEQAVRQALALAPGEEPGEARLETLRALTSRLLIENPFERSGQGRSFEAVRRRVAAELEIPTLELADPVRASAAAAALWPAERGLLRHRLGLFEREIRPLLATNYFREYDRTGKLEDHFWKIDLPFLLLFLGEFAWRWRGAVRQRRYARWWIYPLFHWYDVIGLLPTAYFRMFRPLRAVSIYMRLRRSELSTVGRDLFSRAAGTIGAIVAEEVSDRVALILLNELEEEILAGTHRRIAAAVVAGRRAAIEAMLARQLGALLGDPELLDGLRRLLELNLDHAVERSRALDEVPLPGVVVRPLARSIGQVVVAATVESLAATPRTAAGERAIGELAEAVTARVLSDDSVGTLEPLVREIALEVIEKMKETVSVRKWALGDEERRARAEAVASGRVPASPS